MSRRSRSDDAQRQDRGGARSAATSPGSVRAAASASESPRLAAQRERIHQLQSAAPAPNRTGLPDALKSGIESLSGHSLDAVRVHYDSPRPAQLQAHAFAQGTDIHVAPGQEKQLPHEAWHIVQQAQGRVKPTLHTPDGVPVNDNAALEREADRMGSDALAAGARTVQKAAAQDDGPHVDARTDGASIGYSVQRKALRAPSGATAPLQMNRDKAGLASAKAGRRADRQRRGDQGRHEARRQDLPAFEPGPIGGVPTGDVGVMLTMLMLLGQINAAHAQPMPVRDARPLALPSPARQPGVPGNSTALALPQRPGQVALPQGGSSPMRPAPRTMPSTALAPFDVQSGPVNSTALAPLPRSHAARRPPGRVSALEPTRPVNASSGTPLNVTGDASKANATANASKVDATASASKGKATAKPSAPQWKPQPIPETSIDKSGKVTFSGERMRERYADPGTRAGVEAVAIKTLMSQMPTAAGILDELAPYNVSSQILRADLANSVGGEADLGNDKYISVNANHDLRKNALVAAHEYRHREQFASGILDNNSNPYRKAYAEIEAKNVGLDTYVELKDRGYFEDDVKSADPERLDLAERSADPQAYDRKVFKSYLGRYRGNETAKYPDFASDAALDQHIADQRAYAAARRTLSRIELEIKQRGLSPDDRNLPAELKDPLIDARAQNRLTKRTANRSHP